ncbi:hypothetical protein SAMN05428642_10393 [Flaviramulus basaltis]|uniref:Uncharacterized protein n=1 Tax=Flaviramulus basaltis TaxID=369401 RepID=A0A1K2IMD4_9FLAO|nr:hypothetical protein [Flaviramulus basaltis]SFZ93368.1 hypothetical protein SAMN05428642_10393 [Flaviramulus basaltis]
MRHDTKPLTQSNSQNELLSILKKELALHSVYVISCYREKRAQETNILPSDKSTKEFVTYTLLIIAHKTHSKGLGDLMDDLYGKMQQRCRVYIIFYTMSNVKKRLDFGDNFLTQAIFKTPCIHKEDDTLSRFSLYGSLYHQNVYDLILETWTNRMDRAGYLLSIIGNIEPKEDSLAMLSTMHHALEQICLGLLYLFWEFKPQHYSLPYMLHLCSHFTTLPQTIFPKETYGLHRIYYMLCNAHHIMRFKSSNEFTYKDTDKAYNRCERFYDEAKAIGETHLEHLMEIHSSPFPKMSKNPISEKALH